MSGFTVPFSSPQPPSTPDSRLRSQSANLFAALASTTPAGPPPPSSAASFTPADPPPPSFFGSSMFGSTTGPGTGMTPFGGASGKQPIFPFGKKEDIQSPSAARKPPARGILKKGAGNGGSAGTNGGQFGKGGFTMPFGNSGESSEEEYDDREEEDNENDEEEDEDEDAEGESDGEMGDDMDVEWETAGLSKPSKGTGSRDLKQSQQSMGASLLGLPDVEPARESKFGAIVRDVASDGSSSGTDLAPLVETDSLILNTENLVTELYDPQADARKPFTPDSIALLSVPHELRQLWLPFCDEYLNHPFAGKRRGSVGPRPIAEGVNKAAFLANFLLQTRHPPRAKSTNFLTQSKSLKSSLHDSGFHSTRLAPIPEVLLDWENKYHTGIYENAYTDVSECRPNPTSHVAFWETIYSSLLRGKISDVIALLKSADFKYAKTSLEDGSLEEGYRGVQLGNIARVINRLIQVLEQCPAVQYSDWDVTSSDWTLFRSRATQTLDDLTTFAEGKNRGRGTTTDSFAAEHFGLSQRSDMAMSIATRKAESKVPWAVYENLKAAYGILAGGANEVMAFAQDWIEASIGLTVWWDKTKDRPQRKGRSFAPDPFEVSPSGSTAYYLDKLAESFARATEENSDTAFSVNTQSPVEIGLASCFEGDIAGAVLLLRAWSLPIATAIVEVAMLAGWLETNKSATALIEGFDKSDLMVLNSYKNQNSDEYGPDRDDILVDYANRLSNRRLLSAGVLQQALDGSIRNIVVEKEGWELGIQVLGRLWDMSRANDCVTQLLDGMDLDSSEVVDKVLLLCNGLGMADQAQKIAERYADALAEETHNYGEALWYYARAHHPRKIKEVTDLLLSYSLIQSAAFPPATGLDDYLKRLLGSPQPTLHQLVDLDPEAAAMLHRQLAGYATLRRFYDIRDDGLADAEPKKGPSLLARKKNAVVPLVALISSASDSIRGGLFDASAGSVVSVDFLLTLLGEALVFVDQTPSLLSLPQSFTLLAAIEDLHSAPSTLLAATHDVLASALQHHDHTSPAATASSALMSPPAALQKTLSDLTASSSAFTLLGSALLDSAAVASIGSSGVLVGPEQARRGWDWRAGLRALPAAGPGAAGSDVLRILRLGLAREVARGWVEQADAGL